MSVVNDLARSGMEAEGYAAVEAISALVAMARRSPGGFDPRPVLREQGNKILDAVGQLCDLVDQLDTAEQP